MTEGGHEHGDTSTDEDRKCTYVATRFPIFEMGMRCGTLPPIDDGSETPRRRRPAPFGDSSVPAPFGDSSVNPCAPGGVCSSGEANHHGGTRGRQERPRLDLRPFGLLRTSLTGPSSGGVTRTRKSNEAPSQCRPMPRPLPKCRVLRGRQFKPCPKACSSACAELDNPAKGCLPCATCLQTVDGQTRQRGRRGPPSPRFWGSTPHAVQS